LGLFFPPHPPACTLHPKQPPPLGKFFCFGVTMHTLHTNNHEMEYDGQLDVLIWVSQVGLSATSVPWGVRDGRRVGAGSGGGGTFKGPNTQNKFRPHTPTRGGMDSARRRGGHEEITNTPGVLVGGDTICGVLV